MSTSTVFGQEHSYFKGLGSGISSGNAVLPPQAIPEKKKNDNWKKACLDNLEREGLKQYVENLPMTDYYKMISGDMAYIDLVDEDQDLVYSYVQDFKKNSLNLPTYLKHYDIMYPVVSKIVGEWSMQYDKLRFDTTDETSTNEYIKERTLRLQQYTEALFENQKNKMLALSGVDIKTEFESEEEYQQYQQGIDQIIADHFPEKVDKDMKKNFKTEAAQWAEKTWDRDYERYRINILESLEARDILLTGKSARHYRIGHDYYYPEYWHPVEVFHSKEASLTRLEDSEFVGRVKWYTVTELMSNYGHILSEKERIQIYKSYFGDDYAEFSTTRSSEQSVSVRGEGYFDRMMVPFKGYSDHKLSLEFEEATGIPLSEYTDTATGETRPSYSMPLPNTVLNYGATLSQKLRTDFEIRTDTIQTTEVYWKGSKKIGMMTYKSKSGSLNTIEVDEEILGDVLDQYDIKKLRKVSLTEYNMLSDDDKENTLVWVDTPVGYRGIKIKVSGIGLEDDIYKVEKLPYQIKGEKGNIFDIKLPVTGHVGNSYCKMIRPYQIAFNYFMNQTQSYLEKEIGAFFVIDVNAIPTEYFNMKEGDDALYGIRNLAKTTGFLPTDFSRNTLNQNGGLTFNPMTYQSATYTEPMQRNLVMAEKYKWMAYETLGLTPTSMGSPSEYSTVEGINVGQKSYFAQTFGIEQILMENKRSNVEIHMTIAQYCQLHNKDANYIYMASNNELEFLQSIKDEDFSLRQIDVRAIYNPTKNMLFQQLRQTLMANNTMGNDALSTIELFMSDDFMELKEAAMRARQYMEKTNAQKMEHEKELMAAETQKEMKIHEDEVQAKRERNETTLEAASLSAQGRTAALSHDVNGTEAIQQSTENYLKNKEIDNKDANEKSKIQNDLANASKNIQLKLEQMQIDKEKLNIERDKISAMKYQADARNRDSIVNKN